MPPVSAARHFEIISTVLALAEERGSVALSDAAGVVGVPVKQLRVLLDPVLYLEFRTADHEVVDQTRAFLLDESDTLQVVDRNWLRDLQSNPPSHDAALRLLVSATVYQATEPPSPALDSALAKLRAHVAINLVLPVDQPPCLDAARAAHVGRKSLRFRYVKWKDAIATEREVLPYTVFGKWGHWFVQGPEVGSEIRKEWRIDRMDSAVVGDTRFELPDDVIIPDWLDLSDLEQTVTVRVTEAVLASLPQPHQIDSQRADGEFVVAEITVAGEHQLDHILVALGPDGSVLAPAELAERRRTVARKLLNA
jgi:predicted DNA-binding transcriptional regulator YafY